MSRTSIAAWLVGRRWTTQALRGLARRILHRLGRDISRETLQLWMAGAPFGRFGTQVIQRGHGAGMHGNDYLPPMPAPGRYMPQQTTSGHSARNMEALAVRISARMNLPYLMKLHQLHLRQKELTEPGSGSISHRERAQQLKSLLAAQMERGQ